MAITSDELNFLIYRYLMESGFTHSAFAFGYESFVHKSKIDSNDVPPGALITFIQKGLQYLELEANLSAEDGGGSDITADYSSLSTRELLTKSLDELKASLIKRRDEAAADLSRVTLPPRGRIAAAAARAAERQAASNAAAQAMRLPPVTSSQQPSSEPPVAEGDQPQPMDIASPPAAVGVAAAAASAVAPFGGAAEPPQPVTSGSPCTIPDSQVTILEGHTDEAFTCAWSPAVSHLASGSGDGTARIWDLGQLAAGAGRAVSGGSCQLAHTVGETPTKKDVTTMDWSSDGSRLATGSYDGIARIWSKDGEVLKVLRGHKGPIFSLKWSRNGALLLSGSVDKSAIVWDGCTGAIRQRFEFHSAPTMDVDWGSGMSFATCSSDMRIFVCKVGDTEPTRCLEGHSDEVNNVKWDPSGKLLASCSDDMTARTWSATSDSATHVLHGHTKEIYTLKWSPTGPGSQNSDLPAMIVTGSFDYSIRIWDASSGACINILTRHTEPVYSVAVSPNGRYLASGSFDKTLVVWDIQEGKAVRVYIGGGGIFEVSWERSGQYVAACFSDKTVAVINLRL